MSGRRLEIAFTQRSIAALQPPARGREYHYDKGCKGMAVCVMASGIKTYYLMKRVHGRYQRIRLGPFPDLSVEQARKLAAKAIADIADGKNPNEMRRSARNQKTLGELWEKYRDEHAKLHKKTWERDERRWGRDLAKWTTRRLPTISRSEVQTLFKEIAEKHGPYAANQTLELLRHLYVKAATLIDFDGPNPCDGIKRFRKKERDRFLSADELKRFLTAIESEGHPTTRDALKTCLFTGARRSNVFGMRWADLNLQTATWRIPGDVSKNKEPMIVHLPPPALEILERRKAAADPKAEWVFPSWSSTGHLVEPKFAWKKILAAAGLEDLRVHDLRRTLGSWQAAGGASLLVIGKSLGHTNPSATKIYARLAIDPVRASVNAATAEMLKAASTDNDNNAPTENGNPENNP
jgi:integrase